MNTTGGNTASYLASGIDIYLNNLRLSTPPTLPLNISYNLYFSPYQCKTITELRRPHVGRSSIDHRIPGSTFFFFLIFLFFGYCVSQQSSYGLCLKGTCTEFPDMSRYGVIGVFPLCMFFFLPRTPKCKYTFGRVKGTRMDASCLLLFTLNWFHITTKYKLSFMNHCIQTYMYQMPSRYYFDKCYAGIHLGSNERYFSICYQRCFL